MAEAQGFEPWRQFPDLPVFKTGPFNHLGKPPNIWWEKLDLNQQCPQAPDLQSGGDTSFPILPN